MKEGEELSLKIRAEGMSNVVERKKRMFVMGFCLRNR